MKWLQIYFFSVGSTNYGNELLQQAHDFWWNLPTATQMAIFCDYLVNPSGLPGHFHEQDLLQEHLNFWLKWVFNGQKNAFDSCFLREAVSLNIVDLKDLLQSFMSMIGLAKVHLGCTQADIEADINLLGALYPWESQHLYITNCTQTTTCVDGFVLGGEKLLTCILVLWHNYFRIIVIYSNLIPTMSISIHHLSGKFNLLPPWNMPLAHPWSMSTLPFRSISNFDAIAPQQVFHWAHQHWSIAVDINPVRIAFLSSSKVSLILIWG